MTPTTAAPPERGEFSRGWKVLVASLLGTACGASPLPFNTIGFFIDPLQAEFGWSRTEISLGITIYGLLAALLAPVFGMCSRRLRNFWPTNNPPLRAAKPTSRTRPSAKSSTCSAPG